MTLTTKIENLPAELREKGLFCCWRYEERPGAEKPTKSPYNPRTGGGAQSTNPATFSLLEATVEAVERSAATKAPYSGVGVGIFGEVCAIDIDHCIDHDGAFSALAADVMTTMSSYTEKSPSGTGIRILFKAPGFQYDTQRYYINNKKNGLEVYVAGATNKFVTVTGDVIAECGYEERGAQLQTVLDKYMGRPDKKTAPPPTLPGPVSLEDTELIERAKQGKNGGTFAALWAGDTAGYPSRSEADIALCNALAWWTDRDAARVDRLFRQSGLMREKWDERHGRDTYGRLTVENAVSSCQGGYSPVAYRQQEAARAASPAADVGAGFAPFEPFVPPDTSKLPPFPVEYLPPVLQDMAAAAAVNLQVAVDMAAVAELAVMALCVQGKFIINPKPGWLEQLNLYAAIVARPSDRKTPALALMTRPVHAFEKEENERRAPRVDEYRMKHDVLTKRIANMKELAAKPTLTKGKAVDMNDITELQYEIADLEREGVKPLRLLADDTTQEALASLMAANDGRMGIVSDEGGIFDIIAGRYSSGKANMDIFLKSYTGARLQIDRQGRPGEAIDHPTLTMLLMVQPVVLEAIMGNQDFAGRGFLARPLYSLPVSTVGHRTYDTPPVPPQVEAAYTELVDTLLSVPELGEARIIKLTPEAHQEAKRFFEALEPRLMDDMGDLGDLEGWGGKYHGQVMRIAGILHCCTHGKVAAQVPLTAETMGAAQTIGEYFLAHARAAFQMMGLTESQDTKDAKYILKRLEAGGQIEISKRDLYQLCKGRLAQVEDMEPGLKILVERGYIAIESIKTGGRPTEKVRVNPYAQKYQYPQNPA